MFGRSLAGGVVLVAGAAGGAGEATALALADAGAAVGLLARAPEQLEITVKEITSAGGTAIAVSCDVADGGAIAQAVSRVVAELGRLDAVVANAAVARYCQVEDMQEAEWQPMLQVNLAGACHLAGAAVPHLLATAAGAAGVADFVAIGSSAGRGSVGGAVLRATQDGLRTYLRELRGELAPRGVRVGLVESDSVDSRILDGTGQPVPAVLAPAPRVPLVRPAEVAGAVCYLLTRPADLAVTELRIGRPV